MAARRTPGEVSALVYHAASEPGEAGPLIPPARSGKVMVEIVDEFTQARHGMLVRGPKQVQLILFLHRLPQNHDQIA